MKNNATEHWSLFAFKQYMKYFTEHFFYLHPI